MRQWGHLSRSAQLRGLSCWDQHHGEHRRGACPVCARVVVYVLTAQQVFSQRELLSKQQLSGKHKPCWLPSCQALISPHLPFFLTLSLHSVLPLLHSLPHSAINTHQSFASLLTFTCYLFATSFFLDIKVVFFFVKPQSFFFSFPVNISVHLHLCDPLSTLLSSIHLSVFS